MGRFGPLKTSKKSMLLYVKPPRRAASNQTTFFLPLLFELPSLCTLLIRSQGSNSTAFWVHLRPEVESRPPSQCRIFFQKSQKLSERNCQQRTSQARNSKFECRSSHWWWRFFYLLGSLLLWWNWNLLLCINAIFEEIYFCHAMRLKDENFPATFRSYVATQPFIKNGLTGQNWGN